MLLILAKYAMFGIDPVVIPEPVPGRADPDRAHPAQQGTDLAYVEKLADEAGYVFYVEPGRRRHEHAYWGPEIKIGVPQPALNLDMDAHTNVESLSFSFDGTSRDACRSC